MLLEMNSSFLLPFFFFSGKIAEEERGESNFKIRYLAGVKTIFDCNCGARHFLSLYSWHVNAIIYLQLLLLSNIIDMENEGASQSNAGIFFLPASYTAERSRSKKSNQTSCVVARQIFTRINIPIRAIKRVEPARKSPNAIIDKYWYASRVSSNFTQKSAHLIEYEENKNRTWCRIVAGCRCSLAGCRWSVLEFQGLSEGIWKVWKMVSV